MSRGRVAQWTEFLVPDQDVAGSNPVAPVPSRHGAESHHGVALQHVEIPRDLPRTATASWREVETLLYLLTLLFGVVELPGVTVHGVWRGTDGLDWQRERLKLDCRSTTLEPQLERDLAIADAYDELPTE